MLVRLYDTKQRVYADLILKLKWTLRCKIHDSTAKEIMCRRTADNLQTAKYLKYGKTRHLTEFCDRIQQFTQKLSESITERKEYLSREHEGNNYQSWNQDTNAFYQKERSRYGEDYQLSKYPSRTTVKQHEDKIRMQDKSVKSFKRTTQIFAKSVNSNETKEPNLSKS